MKDCKQQRWKDARFGMFIHWGLYAIPARGEWVRSVEEMPKEDYMPFFHQFNPVDFDPKQWARAAKEAGMKYVVLTAKHHDGFCLFDSQYTDFKSTNTPYGRDIVKEFVEAVRAEGLKVGLYFTLLDWYHDDYPHYGDKNHPMRNNPAYSNEKRDFSRYVEYMHNQVREICTRNNILMIADEVQTGFARTGRMFAYQYEQISPDILVMGKALGGGIMPVSAIAADAEVLGVYTPGTHGSTFGGNPLACAVAIKAMEILVRDDYPQMAAEKGAYFMERLRQIKNPHIKEIRGKGLLIGMEFDHPAEEYFDKMMAHGVLAKDTHECTIRFAPPLTISYAELNDACDRITQALQE